MSPEVTVRGFKKWRMFSAVGETDDMEWNGSEEFVDVRSECEEDEGTDYGDETVTLVCKGR
jgi:hypothetical protein